MSQTSYSTRLRRATWLAFGMAPVTGIAAALILRSVTPGEHFWSVFAGLLLVCALGMWACVPWWNRLDDMQKQYHTVSWYWGGLGGGIGALMAVIAASGAQSPASLGGLSVLMGQMIAFLVFWGVWAWRRRGPTA